MSQNVQHLRSLLFLHTQFSEFIALTKLLGELGLPQLLINGMQHVRLDATCQTKETGMCFSRLSEFTGKGKTNNSPLLTMQGFSIQTCLSNKGTVITT